MITLPSFGLTSRVRFVAVLLLSLTGSNRVIFTYGEEQVMLPLADIEAGLLSHPPEPGLLKEREPLIAGLEKWVDRDDAVYWDRKPETSNPEFFDYYLSSIQRALNHNSL